MIPLESPVPEIGPPGSESGGRKRTHGTRPAARLRKRRISHRPLPATRLSSTLLNHPQADSPNESGGVPRNRLVIASGLRLRIDLNRLNRPRLGLGLRLGEAARQQFLHGPVRERPDQLGKREPAARLREPLKSVDSLRVDPYRERIRFTGPLDDHAMPSAYSRYANSRPNGGHVD